MRLIKSFYYKSGIKIKIAISFIILVFVIILFLSYQNWNKQKAIMTNMVSDFVKGYINSSSKVLLEYITLDQPFDVLIFIKNFSSSLPQIDRISVYQLINSKNLKIIDSKDFRVKDYSIDDIKNVLKSENYQIFNHFFYIREEVNRLESYESREHIVFNYPIVFPKDKVELDGNYVRIVGYMSIFFSKDLLYQPLKDTVYSIVVNSLIWLLIGIIGVFIFAILITKPIYLIISAVKRIRSGDLDFRIEIKTKDELGLLSSQFNDMVLHLREKIEMQKFVSKQTTRVIENKIREGGALNPHKENVVVFFADIRGFTSMSELLEPDKVIEILNYYFEEMSKIIIEQGGDIDKYVGDQIFAIFKGEDKDLKAIHSAILIQEMIKNKNKEKTFDIEIKVGIGINMGEVVAGKMGSSVRMDYTVIGDVVNTGARLCSVAGPYEIIVSENIYNNLKDTYSFVKKEKIKLKGKAKEVVVYSLVYQ